MLEVQQTEEGTIKGGKCHCGIYWAGAPPWHRCEQRSSREFSSPLDLGIERAVHLLMDNGVETYESCQGGPGHAFPEPTVRFYGQRAEGLRALSVALMHRLPVLHLRRIWTVVDGEPTGPDWELTFVPAQAWLWEGME